VRVFLNGRALGGEIDLWAPIVAATGTWFGVDAFGID
jgi:hypothetical protein